MRAEIIVMSISTLLGASEPGCDKSSDDIQRDQQERILAEGTAQTGMPAIKNFRERKLMKDILEMRDQDGLLTFTYLYTYDGRLVFFCNSVGYGLPYATQYTNPQKFEGGGGHYITLPQADPNGLFSPSSSEGTWVICKDPKSDKTAPVYVEPRIVVSPFELGEAKATVASPVTITPKGR